MVGCESGAAGSPENKGMRIEGWKTQVIAKSLDLAVPGGRASVNFSQRE